jgi:predicted DCC family thiol-disulfide oxidoreductase YuxK
MLYSGVMEPYLILYDEDCGFCRWSLSQVLDWDRRKRLRPVALQSEEADEYLGDMNQGRKMASWHLVDPEGTVWSAGAAAAPLFRVLPGGRLLSVIAAAFPGLTELIYRLVAGNRELLARLIGQEACSVDPRRKIAEAS